MSSHRSRFRAKQRAMEAQSAVTSQRREMFDILNYSNGLEATKSTPNRGYLDVPPRDPSKVATGYRRKQLLDYSNWLDINDGYAKGVVLALSNLIGYYTLAPATTDAKWNAIAAKFWWNATKTASVFDKRRNLSHTKWQLELSRKSLKHGDCLTLRTYSETGRPQILMYDSHQIDCGEKRENDRFRDGIYHDQFYAHDGYNLVSNDGKTSTVVPASMAFYYGPRSSGELRPMPRLTHAMNDLRDLNEIDLDTKLGIKRAQFVGLYRKRQKATGYGPQGFNQGLRTESTGTHTNHDDTTQETLINVENMSEKTSIQSLDEGEDFGIIARSEPGPNETAFKESRLAKIAIGLGLPSSTVFYMLGAGGPEVRFHMALLQRWIEIELIELYQTVESHYFWTMGTAIARRDLPEPDDPEWWNMIALPSADLTIDRGRELSGKIAALKVGAITHADLHAERGKDGIDQIRIQAKYIADAAAAAAEFGLAGGLSDLMPDWNPAKQSPFQPS